MAAFRITLPEDERRVVNAERDSHPEAHIRRKMLVVWLLHCGLTRQKAAEIAGLSRPTVQRYVAAFHDGGLDGLGGGASGARSATSLLMPPPSASHSPTGP
jgi:hypothetical protein